MYGRSDIEHLSEKLGYENEVLRLIADQTEVVDGTVDPTLIELVSGKRGTIVGSQGTHYRGCQHRFRTGGEAVEQHIGISIPILFQDPGWDRRMDSGMQFQRWCLAKTGLAVRGQGT